MSFDLLRLLVYVYQLSLKHCCGSAETVLQSLTKVEETLKASSDCKSNRSLIVSDSAHMFRSVTQKSDLEPPIKLPTPPQSRVLDYKDFDEVVMVCISFNSVLLAA